MVISTVGSRGTTDVNPIGHTELAEAGTGGASDLHTQMQYATDNSPAWDNLGALNNVGTSVEYAAGGVDMPIGRGIVLVP